MSPGNGHPYSWAAICNGYDPVSMADCPFSAIPEYLARQSWPGDRISGVRVTHIWTQNDEESHRIARASCIDSVTSAPEDMIGSIDALLLARDDADNHIHFAKPFLRAGLPVYIDKPVALSEAQFDVLHGLQRYPGQIFSCSALRFASELHFASDEAERIGPIWLIEGTTPKYWETYAIHLVDPLLMMLGYTSNPVRIYSKALSENGRILRLRWPDGGPEVDLRATGNIPSPLQLRIVGKNGEKVLTFHDSFSAFKFALAEFVASVGEGRSRLPESFNRRAVQILEMGLQ